MKLLKVLKILALMFSSLIVGSLLVVLVSVAPELGMDVEALRWAAGVSFVTLLAIAVQGIQYDFDASDW